VKEIEKAIDLGWITLSPDEMQAFNSERSNPAEEFFIYLFVGYRMVPHLTKGFSVGRYRLTSEWYISEIEDALRTGLALFDKVIVEVPSMEMESIEEGYFLDEDVSCDVSFLGFGALSQVADHFGDAVAGKELLLLPTFSWPEWEDGDSDEFGFRSPSNAWGVRAILGPLSEVWSSLAKGAHFQMAWPAAGTLQPEDLRLPVLVGADVRDIVKLRRDEPEAFRRWRTYLEQARQSPTATPRELMEAIEQGVAELDSRVEILRKKGLLDAIGATAVAASIGVAMSLDDKRAMVAGALGLAGVATTAMKGYLEASEGRKDLRRDRRFFWWVAQQLRQWG
jgi:hypothetical protein